MNTTVNSELAKLLKLVGFEYQYDWSPSIDNLPTIADVVMWLYEKDGIWIECNHCGTFNEFTFKVSNLNEKNIKKEPHYMNDFGKGFNSPTEAYLAAIEYTLKYLL